MGSRYAPDDVYFDQFNMVHVTIINSRGEELLTFIANGTRTILEQVEEKKPEILLPKEMTPEELKKKLAVQLPYSCRAGACMTCCVTIKKGLECIHQTLGGEKFIDTDKDQALSCIAGIKQQFIDDVHPETKEPILHTVVLEMMEF